MLLFLLGMRALMFLNLLLMVNPLLVLDEEEEEPEELKDVEDADKEAARIINLERVVVKDLAEDANVEEEKPNANN
jgi:hypothetical protein